MKGQFPWIGRSRGSAGGMTTCKINDKNVMRAKAFEVTNPNTPAQQNQRNYFAELNMLSGSFTSEQLKTLFPMKPKEMSRRNALTKQLAEDWTIDNGVKVIDFANIDTLGNAPTMNMGTTTCEIGDDYIEITLDDTLATNTELRHNNFIVAIVNETKGVIRLGLEYDYVESAGIAIDLPSGWESTDSVHAIPLITNIMKNSPMPNFGSFIIKTRPEKVG